MYPRKNILCLATVPLLALALWTAGPACSSPDNNPAPGGSSTSSGSSGSGGSSSGTGSSSSGGSGDDGGGSSSSGSACSSDAATCNSCTASDTDPYNACSTFVTGCIQFDDSRVPMHPVL